MHRESYSIFHTKHVSAPIGGFHVATRIATLDSFCSVRSYTIVSTASFKVTEKNQSAIQENFKKAEVANISVINQALCLEWFIIHYDFVISSD